MTIQTQDIRDRALRVIAYGSWQDMKKFLAEIDPDGYYPEAEKRNGLWVHIARLVCAKQLDRREPPAAEARRTPPRPRLTEAQERARGELARRLAAGENISLGLFL